LSSPPSPWLTTAPSRPTPHLYQTTAHPIARRRLEAPRKLSLRGLAKLSGIHFTKLHHFEHGLAPSREELEAIARALGCSVDDLRPTSEVA